jgi:hypothetical protein
LARHRVIACGGCGKKLRRVYLIIPQISQNFEIEFSIISQVPPKKIWAKNKKNILPSAGPRGHSAKLLLKNKKNLPSV